MPILVVRRYPKKLECCDPAPWDEGMADPLKNRLSPRVTTPNLDTLGQILRALVGSLINFGCTGDPPYYMMVWLTQKRLSPYVLPRQFVRSRYDVGIKW